MTVCIIKLELHLVNVVLSHLYYVREGFGLEALEKDANNEASSINDSRLYNTIATL